MKSILVSKQGAVFRTRAEMRTASAAGEQGETEGVIRHLLSRGDLNVVYFGKYRGEVLPGLTVVESDTRGVTEHSSGMEQKFGFAKDLAALQAVEDEGFIGAINIAGQPPTFSHIDNPRGARIQACAVHYTAPILAAIQNLKLQRVVINNDPRTYPRDQEMSYGWDHVRPVALLDQCASIVPQTVGGRAHIRKSVYSRCEGWCYHEPPTQEEAYKIHRVCCVAHAHIADGCAKCSPDPWSIIFANEAEFFVYGKGWEAHPSYDPEFMPGTIKPLDVRDLVAGSLFCPVVAHTPGFYTGKVYVLTNLNCVPLLFGDGQSPHTWDPQGVYLPLDSPWRITKAGDIDRIVASRSYEEQLAHWKMVTLPQWDLLDSCVDDLMLGRKLDFDTYGGYKQC